MMVDENIEQEGADWVAAMISDQFESFVPSMFCDMVFATERQIRADSGDAAMDHATMTDRLMEAFIEDPDVPTDNGAVMPNLIFEILHWEDQFRSMAGQERNLRPPTGQR